MNVFRIYVKVFAIDNAINDRIILHEFVLGMKWAICKAKQHVPPANFLPYSGFETSEHSPVFEFITARMQITHSKRRTKLQNVLEYFPKFSRHSNNSSMPLWKRKSSIQRLSLFESFARRRAKLKTDGFCSRWIQYCDRNKSLAMSASLVSELLLLREKLASSSESDSRSEKDWLPILGRRLIKPVFILEFVLFGVRNEFVFFSKPPGICQPYVFFICLVQVSKKLLFVLCALRYRSYADTDVESRIRLWD